MHWGTRSSRVFTRLSRPSSSSSPHLCLTSFSQIILFSDDNSNSNSSSTPPPKSNIEHALFFKKSDNFSPHFLRGLFLHHNSSKKVPHFTHFPFDFNHPHLSFRRNFLTRAKEVKRIEVNDQHSQRAVTTALWCNFLVFSLKFGVWMTTSSHVMLAEVIHSVADFANQALLAYGLSSSRRGPDALHPPYGISQMCGFG